jgi:hypothetical protein
MSTADLISARPPTGPADNQRSTSCLGSYPPAGQLYHPAPSAPRPESAGLPCGDVCTVGTPGKWSVSWTGASGAEAPVVAGVGHRRGARS